MKRIALAPSMCAVALFVAGCGGKLAPLDSDAGDAGDAGDADASTDAGDDADSGPFVTSVTPSSGPNCGGTRVVIGGHGFVPGESTVTFAGFPATGSCASSTQCTAVSAFAGYQDFDQQVHVQVAVPGSSADGGPRVSPMTPLDVFTYTAGPQCHFELSCQDRVAFPDMVITCPTSVVFYSQWEHQLSTVASGTTYSFGAEDFPIAVVACFGDQATTSCTTFVSLPSAPEACGTGDLCFLCALLGGKCSEGPTPVCNK